MKSIFELASENPWWTNPEAINQDIHLKTFDSSSIHWEPAIKRRIQLDVDGYVLYTLRGPRQVGKTTLMKILIREKLQSGIDPFRIFFSRCDLVKSPKKLEENILSYIKQVRAQTNEHLYLFIDEISSVKNWQLAIKSLFDQGALTDLTLLACGSHAMDIQSGAEKLPGRTGRGDIVQHKRLVPMKFAEFIRCYDKVLAAEFFKRDLHNGEKRRRVLLDLIQSKRNDNLTWFLMLKKDLDVLLDIYLLTGGIAKAINEYKNTSTIQNATYTDYIHAFQSDLAHWKRETTTAKNILEQIIKSMGCKVSWNSLTEDVASMPTIKSYVDNMYDCFTLAYFYHLRVADKASKATKKGKKIYILDPFIFHSLRYWTSSTGTETAFESSMNYLADDSNRGIIIESLVADHLIRLIYNLRPSDPFDARNEIFYWEPHNSEIDFIANMGPQLLPVESKFRTDIPSQSLRNVSQFAKNHNLRGLIITKNDFQEYENTVLVPASIFLSLI